MMQKMQQNRIRISVRNLVEFVLRSGDLDNRRGGNEKDAMLEGTRIHRKIQKQRMGSLAEYQAEVSLKTDVPYHDVVIALEGRADGVYEDEQGILCVEEIKGVYAHVEAMKAPVPVHEAQALCYAYILCKQRERSLARIVLTYCDMDTTADDVKQFTREYTTEQLQYAFDSLIDTYGKWADYTYRHRMERKQSIQGLEFPYPYREGQRDVVVSAYKVMTMGKVLFVQAPTGIGKTLSTVFPAVKALGEGYGDKIFYMTAKTITRGVARETFDILSQNGMKAGAVTLTAKDKICFRVLEAKEAGTEDGVEPDCNPESCPYAKGHYDRVNEAVYDLLVHEQNAGRETILEYARKHQVCPFEMSLDVTYWMDMIICDYNYVFDPRARLQRYFADGVPGQDFIFLIDEAHNLVERAREMYSATLYKEMFLEAVQHYKDISAKISSDAKRCNRLMLELKRSCEGAYQVLETSDIAPLANAVLKMYTDIQKYEEEHPKVVDREGGKFFFALRDFLQVFDQLGKDYKIYTQLEGTDSFMLKLLCVQPASQLNECLEKGKSAVFFSATMLPMLYYKEVLRGNNEDFAICAKSPFDSSQRLLCISQEVTSKYTKRNPSEYEKIAEYLLRIVGGRQGNYLAFFPSFSYLEEIRDLLLEMEPDFRIICQESYMTEGQREAFLLAFEPGDNQEESLLGMCVTGGIFSEGIDLTKDRLIGVIIVGTGLPQICPEREILRQYYDENRQDFGNGFAYAYTYPGMNRVLQAAGRLIRTKEDWGVIALLDYRFLNPEYRALFPQEWNEGFVQVRRAEELTEQIERFWSQIQ